MHKSLQFPEDGLRGCVNDGKWEQCDDVLPMLRQFAMKSPVTELNPKAEHAELVVLFLLGLRERRRHQRARVVETAKALMRSEAWEQEIQKHPLLLQITSPTLPPPPASTLLLQVTGLALPSPPPPAPLSVDSAAASPPEAPPSVENSQVHCETMPTAVVDLPAATDSNPSATTCMSEDSIAVEAMPVDTSSAAEPTTLKSLPPSVAEEFHQGVWAVIEINSLVLFENWSVSAFAQLRQGALHVAQLPADSRHEILQAEAEHCKAVLTFLIDFVKGNTFFSNQVCEVLHILLACPSWLERVHASEIMPCMDDGIPPQVRAFFEKTFERKANSRPSDRWGKRVRKQLKHWLLGCGQKNGAGVTSPRAITARGGA